MGACTYSDSITHYPWNHYKHTAGSSAAHRLFLSFPPTSLALSTMAPSIPPTASTRSSRPAEDVASPPSIAVQLVASTHSLARFSGYLLSEAYQPRTVCSVVCESRALPLIASPADLCIACGTSAPGPTRIHYPNLTPLRRYRQSASTSRYARTFGCQVSSPRWVILKWVTLNRGRTER